MHTIPKMLSLLAPWPVKQCCTVTPATGSCCCCCEYPSPLIIKASSRQQINLDLVSKGGYIELDGVGPIDNQTLQCALFSVSSSHSDTHLLSDKGDTCLTSEIWLYRQQDLEEKDH